jgi:hypothetical protein
MDDPNFTDHMTDHLGNRQRPSGIPEHLLDQVEAAVLSGARAVDAVASAGRNSGALVRRSVASPDVFDRFGERYGDPLTELQECVHLAVASIQPRYVYGAAPDRVLCGTCLPVLPDAEGESNRTCVTSIDCDACGSETNAEDIRFGNLSNGMVTYLAVKICSDCMAIGS